MKPKPGQDPIPDPDRLALARWRLVLGAFAESGLGGNSLGGGGNGYSAMDAHLDFLYGREHRERGFQTDGRDGGDGASALTVPDWVRGVRDLFPEDSVEILERHALEKYDLTQLVTDPEVLSRLKPSYDLMKSLLSFRHLMQGETLEMARAIVRRTIEEIREKLANEIRRTLWGKVNRQQHGPVPLARNLDWRRTLRDNLKHYDPESERLVAERLRFFVNSKRQLSWHVILAVDCSGSMMDSVIYSAVMAGIFHGLPSLRTSLVAFDTSVVDLSDRIDDPTEVLMSVQLGGGTLIGRALNYCETLVENPHRTILVVVTDFYEGQSEGVMLGAVKRLCENGVRVLGLGALGPDAKPDYHRELAAKCVELGAEVAALTPNRLAEWLGKVIS